MPVTNYDELAEHIGHAIRCTAYGPANESVGIYCEDCQTLLVSYDSPEPPLTLEKVKRKIEYITAQLKELSSSNPKYAKLWDERIELCQLKNQLKLQKK